jgi:hypothetical protein
LSGVSEGAVKTLKRAPAVGARESARGDIHRILPRYHRRSIEVEPYRRSTTTSAVRRDPVNRENARGRSRIDKAADVNGKISQLGKDNAVTGWLGTDRGTRRLSGRWRYSSSGCSSRCRCRRRRGWLVSEGAGEFRRTPNAALKSASGNVHDVETLHDR